MRYRCDKCGGVVTKLPIPGLTLPTETWFEFRCVECHTTHSPQWVGSLEYNNQPDPRLGLEHYDAELRRGDEMNSTTSTNRQREHIAGWCTHGKSAARRAR